MALVWSRYLLFCFSSVLYVAGVVTNQPCAGRNNLHGQSLRLYILANNVVMYIPSFSAHRIFNAVVFTLSGSIPHFMLAVTGLKSGTGTQIGSNLVKTRTTGLEQYRKK